MLNSGIYKLYSLKFPERVYVGSSVHCNRRISRHLSELSQKKHINRKLQNHVNKYGISDIYFQILEFCEPVQLLSREQFYIDHFKPYFNLCPVAGSRFGLKNSVGSKIKLKLSYIIRTNPVSHFRYKIRP